MFSTEGESGIRKRATEAYKIVIGSRGQRRAINRKQPVDLAHPSKVRTEALIQIADINLPTVANTIELRNKGDSFSKKHKYGALKIAGKWSVVEQVLSTSPSLSWVNVPG